MSARPALGALGVGLAVVVVLAGCTPGDPGPTGTPSGTPTGTSVYDLAAGDCFDAQGAGLGTTLDRVDPEDCAAPHGYEIYASLLEADGDYPGDDAIRQDAESRCTASFADFVGIRYEDSKLAVGYLAPGRADWAAGNRDVLCFLSDPSGPLTGSAQQTAQ